MSGKVPTHRVCVFCLSRAQVVNSGKVITYTSGSEGEVYRPGWVECMECGATGPVTNIIDGDHTAWDAWNKRPTNRKKR